MSMCELEKVLKNILRYISYQHEHFKEKRMTSDMMEDAFALLPEDVSSFSLNLTSLPLKQFQGKDQAKNVNNKTNTVEPLETRSDDSPNTIEEESQEIDEDYQLPFNMVNLSPRKSQRKRKATEMYGSVYSDCIEFESENEKEKYENEYGSALQKSINDWMATQDMLDKDDSNIDNDHDTAMSESLKNGIIESQPSSENESSNENEMSSERTMQCRPNLNTPKGSETKNKRLGKKKRRVGRPRKNERVERPPKMPRGRPPKWNFKEIQQATINSIPVSNKTPILDTNNANKTSEELRQAAMNTMHSLSNKTAASDSTNNNGKVANKNDKPIIRGKEFCGNFSKYEHDVPKQFKDLSALQKVQRMAVVQSYPWVKYNRATDSALCRICSWAFKRKIMPPKGMHARGWSGPPKSWTQFGFKRWSVGGPCIRNHDVSKLHQFNLKTYETLTGKKFPTHDSSADMINLEENDPFSSVADISETVIALKKTCRKAFLLSGVERNGNNMTNYDQSFDKSNIGEVVNTNTIPNDVDSNAFVIPEAKNVLESTEQVEILEPNDEKEVVSNIASNSNGRNINACQELSPTNDENLHGVVKSNYNCKGSSTEASKIAEDFQNSNNNQFLNALVSGDNNSPSFATDENIGKERIINTCTKGRNHKQSQNTNDCIILDSTSVTSTPSQRLIEDSIRNPNAMTCSMPKHQSASKGNGTTNDLTFHDESSTNVLTGETLKKTAGMARSIRKLAKSVDGSPASTDTATIDLTTESYSPNLNIATSASTSKSMETKLSTDAIATNDFSNDLTSVETKSSTDSTRSSVDSTSNATRSSIGNSMAPKSNIDTSEVSKSPTDTRHLATKSSLSQGVAVRSSRVTSKVKSLSVDKDVLANSPTGTNLSNSTNLIRRSSRVKKDTEKKVYSDEKRLRSPRNGNKLIDNKNIKDITSSKEKVQLEEKASDATSISPKRNTRGCRKMSDTLNETANKLQENTNSSEIQSDIESSNDSNYPADKSESSAPKNRHTLKMRAFIKETHPWVEYNEKEIAVCGVCSWAVKNKKIESSAESFYEKQGKNWIKGNNKMYHRTNYLRHENSQKHIECVKIKKAYDSKNNGSEIKKEVASNEKTTFKCLLCEEKFESKYYLEDHIDEMHSISETKYYNCYICVKKFSLWVNLEEHLEIEHKDLKPFQCVTCKACFSKSIHLRDHMKLHKGETGDLIKKEEGISSPTNVVAELTCSICKEHFLTNPDFARHVQSHIIDASYKCKSCDLQFTKPSLLRLHVFTTKCGQEEEKVVEYKCKKCNKKFSELIDLQSHMLSHEGIQFSSVQCPVCSKLFSNKRYLNNHMKGHD